MDEESSRGPKLMRIFSLLMAASFIIAPLAGAQLGEIAGNLNYQVQVGHTQTLQLHLLNEGNTSIGVYVTAQSLVLTSNKIISANQITPTVTVSPQYAVVPSYGTVGINITVAMPLNNTPYLASWEDIISAQETTNATNPGGALILQGVAKIISVSAIPSTTTSTTTIPPQGFLGLGPYGIAVPIVVIIIIVVAIAYYYYSSKTPKTGKAKKAKKDEEEGEEPESKESIEREIERLRKQKAKLQAEVAAVQSGKKGRKATAKKKAPAKKGGTKARKRKASR